MPIAAEITPIDLRNISSETTYKLFLFFKSQSKMGIKHWREDVEHTFWDGSKFKLNQEVYQRPRKDRMGVTSNQVCYQVIHRDDKPGSGKFSYVYDVGTLIFNPSGSSLYKATKKTGLGRVAKMQIHDLPTVEQKTPAVEQNKQPPRQEDISILSPSTVECLKEKMLINQRADHLHMKKPTISHIPVTSTKGKRQGLSFVVSFSTMDKLPGEDLYDFISRDIKNKILSIPEKFALILALLHAVQSQISQKNLIHRDLKPENIRVYCSEDGTFYINIFDYDAAIDLNSSVAMKKGPAGTLLYGPPELFSRDNNEIETISEKTDLFSVGRVISLIMGMPIKDFYAYNPLKPETYPKLYEHFKVNENRVEREADLIFKTFLLKMLRFNPFLRADLPNAIKTFSKVYQILTGTEYAPPQYPMRLPAVPAVYVEPSAQSKFDYFWNGTDALSPGHSFVKDVYRTYKERFSKEAPDSPEGRKNFFVSEKSGYQKTLDEAEQHLLDYMTLRESIDDIESSKKPIVVQNQNIRELVDIFMRSLDDPIAKTKSNPWKYALREAAKHLYTEDNHSQSHMPLAASNP